MAVRAKRLIPRCIEAKILVPGALPLALSPGLGNVIPPERTREGARPPSCSATTRAMQCGIGNRQVSAVHKGI